MDIDTPNIHTPPEGHGPPEPTHTPTNDDMEIALEEAQHANDEKPATEKLDR